MNPIAEPLAAPSEPEETGHQRLARLRQRLPSRPTPQHRAPGTPIEPATFGATDTRRGWIVTIVLTVIAAVTRFWGLGSPTNQGTPVFDEKHYVPQAWGLLNNGHWVEDNPAYNLVVHPPLGKWMLAIGEWMFGYTPTGWRVIAALSGTIIVFLIIRTTRRITRSTMIGGIAGFLAIVESVLFVQSRMGMLDIFQVLFIVAAMSMLVCDRDQMRRRLYDAFIAGAMGDSPYGPRLGFRWWRFSAGLMLGLTCAVKWSGIYYILIFGALSLAFDVANRKAYWVKRPFRGMLVRDLVPAGMSLGVLAIAVYFVTWIPWFDSEGAVARHEVGDEVGFGGSWAWVPDAWRSLLWYQKDVLHFHETLTNSNGYHHPWESKPWTWPMSLRPVLYLFESGQDMCGAEHCLHAQMLVGAPAMWWLTFPLLLWGLWCWIIRRDVRWSVPLVGYAAGWLPWFANLDRQMYFFYATALAPFLVIGLAIALGDILGLDGRGRWFPPWRRHLGIGITCAYLALTVANFVWLLPILTGSGITAHDWDIRMWLPSWG